MINKLYDLRKEIGLTQGEIASILSISRSYYGMIETGSRNPTLDLAIKIAKVFNRKVEEIFFESKCNEKGQKCSANKAS